MSKKTGPLFETMNSLSPSWHKFVDLIMTADVKDVTQHYSTKHRESQTQLTAFLPEMIHRKNWSVLAKAEGFCPCLSVCLPVFLFLSFTESSVQYSVVIWVLTPHSLIGTMKVPDYVLSWQIFTTKQITPYTSTLHSHGHSPLQSPLSSNGDTTTK